MPQLTADQWAEARAIWESDQKETFGSVAERFGCTRSAVGYAARRQGWQRVGVLQRISQLAYLHSAFSKVAGEPIENPARKPNGKQRGRPLAAAIEAAVDERIKILEKHREEWDVSRQLQREALELRFAYVEILKEARRQAEADGVTLEPETELRLRELLERANSISLAFEASKLAKIATETIAIRQTAERKAWGIDAPPKAPEPGDRVTITIERDEVETVDDDDEAEGANGSDGATDQCRMN